ncbi:hypothetical protein KCU81_g9478, partial [Aureobasidium melanogenum]|uniref:Apple domain-containing protein n=1 Tax=Aureobasidium melanogenum (strain CBS 110374) TaxID=1043003 RepID=A0A074VMV4_AURM1
MNPWIHLTSLLSLTAVVAAAPRTKTCYTNPPTTITKIVTQTCPAPKTVYLDAAGNTVPSPAPTNPANYVTTLPAVTRVTELVYPSSLSCNGGETVTIGGISTVVAGPTVLTNCPCSTRTTVIAPGPVITLPAAFAPGASSGNAGGAAGGNAGGAGGNVATTVVNTYVVYPSAFIGNGGETLTIGGTITVVPGPTVISQCPCTQATAVTVTGPAVTNTITQFIPIPTVIAGATVTSTATVISGVTVTQTTTATATSGAGVPAAGTFGTTVDGVTFLVEEQINYDGTPLALPARKNKRQQTSVNLQVCLETCAENEACAGTSLNTDSSTCLYFSAIFASTRRRDVTIIFATVISRVTPTGTSSLSSSTTSSSSSSMTSSSVITTTSATSTSGTSTSGTSTSGTSTTSGGGTSTSGTSTSGTSTSGTSTSGTATTSQTADPSSDPSTDAPAEEEVVAHAAAPKPMGLTLRDADRNKAGAVVRRGGVLRRRNAEPAAKHAPRKVVIEL